MTLRILTAAATALVLTAGAAAAQSYNAPAGILSATAPGGTEGRAGDRNVFEAEQSRGVLPGTVSVGDLSTGSVRAHRFDRRPY